MWVGRVIFPGKGSIRGQYVSPKAFIPFMFSVIIFGDSASYLLEMTVLISLEGILTQTG